MSLGVRSADAGRRPCHSMPMNPEPTASARTSVRGARVGDIEAVIRLSEPHARTGALRRRSPDDFVRQLGDYQVAEADGAVRGCYALELIDGSERRCAFLYNLCVDESWHGRGLGSRLLGHAVDRLAERGVTVLYTATNRRDRWFEQRGFRLPEPRSAEPEVSRRLVPERRSRLLELDLATSADPHVVRGAAGSSLDCRDGGDPLLTSHA